MHTFQYSPDNPLYEYIKIMLLGDVWNTSVFYAYVDATRLDSMLIINECLKCVYHV